METATGQDARTLAAKQIVYGMHTHALGRVLSYDHAKQRATIQLIIRARLNEEPRKIPPITGVPVLFPAGGGFSMTWPLAKGDEGNVVFMGRSLDEWNTLGAGDITPSDLRRFDLSDAVFCAGLRPLTRPLQNVETDAISIGQEEASAGQDGPRRIQITQTGRVRIGDDQGNDLVSILYDLAGEMLSAQHGPYPLDPIAAAGINALRDKLATLKHED